MIKIRHAQDGLELQTSTISRRGSLSCTVMDGEEKLGFLTIDSHVGGAAGGGIRMTADVDDAEIGELARAMTLKHGFLGLPMGGAKAGIRCGKDATPEERQRRLTVFAQVLAPVLRSGAFVPGSDMGTSFADVRFVLNAARVPSYPRDLVDLPSGYFTALTVAAAVREAALHRGLPLAGARIAIEGFGKVGQSVAALMAQAGARIVGVSTINGAVHDSAGLDVVRLERAALEYGDAFVERFDGAERIERDALLELPVDILVPCAGVHAIHSGNSDRIDAGIIVPGANAPIDPQVWRKLVGRGVLLIPDFISNSGGVLGAAMSFCSFDTASVEAYVRDRVQPRMAAILAEAGRKGVSPQEIAEPLALRRIDSFNSGSPRGGLQKRINAFGVKLYRKGWLPPVLVRNGLMAMLERTSGPVAGATPTA